MRAGGWLRAAPAVAVAARLEWRGSALGNESAAAAAAAAEMAMATGREQQNGLDWGTGRTAVRVHFSEADISCELFFPELRV